MTYKLIGNQSEMTGSINFKSCKIMRNDFTACGQEIDNKSFGIGMAAAVVVAAVGTVFYKGGKWVIGKVGGALAERKAKKQANAQEAQQEVK